MSKKVLVIEITSKCNLECKFCYNIWLDRKSAKLTSLTIEELKEKLIELINQIKFDSICFAGGEPLLIDELDELILFLHEKYSSLEIGIITNGVLLFDTRLKKLVNAGLSFIEISLFTLDRTIYSEISNSEYLEQVKNNILFIQKYGITSRLAITLFNNNIDLLDKLLLFAIGAGIDFIALNPFIMTGRGNEFEYLNLHKSQLLQALSIANEFSINSNMKIHITIPIQKFINKDNYSNLLFSKCECGINKFTLSPDGIIRICEHRKETIKIEAIKDYKNVCKGCNIKLI